MNAYNLHNKLFEALGAGRTELLDPGSGGTVRIDGVQDGILTLSSTGARTFEDADNVPVGTRVLVVSQADTPSINSVSLSDGQYALFVVTLDSSGDNQWVQVGGSTLTGSSILVGTGGTIDLNGVADALVLDADADTSLSAPTDDQIDFEVGGADVLTLTATAFSFAATCFPVLPITDTDGTVEGSIWYDASEDKLKFKTAAGVETITSA